jgi:hypothetical protein
MPIDGGIVVGYLTAYLLKGGKRLADRTFEALLDRLVDRVQERLGPRPVSTLERKPGDTANEALVQDEIDEAMRTDPSFAAELTRLIESLERNGTLPGRPRPLRLHLVDARSGIRRSGLRGHAAGHRPGGCRLLHRLRRRRGRGDRTLDGQTPAPRTLVTARARADEVLALRAGGGSRYAPRAASGRLGPGRAVSGSRGGAGFARQVSAPSPSSTTSTTVIANRLRIVALRATLAGTTVRISA